MNRTTLGLCVAAFITVGFIMWVVGMPQPSATTLSAGLSAQVQANSIPEPNEDSRHTSTAAQVAEFPSGAVVSDDWLLATAMPTGIPIRALQAYANASIAEASENPACGLGWNLLAAIGAQESGHGTYRGATIAEDGKVAGHILGPLLDGRVYDAVRDTDGGALDGDATWDRAVGPMQFLPATWVENAKDGNDDGTFDPNDIDDAARTAAAYLCASGRDLATDKGWGSAVTSYNPNQEYLDAVTAQAVIYGEAAR